MKKFIFVILSANLLFGYCSEPMEPVCLKIGFNSQSDFEFCQMQVKRYLQKLQEYTQCVVNEAIRKRNEAVQKQNEVIRKFNCRASGESFCY